MSTSVLLIDDDEDEHQLFAHYLSSYDPTILIKSAFDGTHALGLLLIFKPNYIFLDINMPGMRGLEVLKRLKSMEIVNEIPVFIFSTNHQLDIKSEALKFGAKMYFEKPLYEEGYRKIFDSLFKR